MSNSQRRWFRLEWLARIQELADLDTQKRAWLNAHPRTGNPHFSFVEYATTYENFANWPDRVSEGLISPEEAEAVTHLDKLVLDYRPPGSDDFDHEAILADHRWLEVVRAAGEAQERLRTMIKDTDEQITLTRPSSDAIEACISSDPAGQ